MADPRAPIPIIPPARAAAWRDNSRRRCKAAGGPWADVDLGDIYAAGGGACHVCGRPLALAGEWDADHVQALDAGGLHELANIRPACVGCNRSRQAAAAPVEASAVTRRALLSTAILAECMNAWGVPCRAGLPRVCVVTEKFFTSGQLRPVHAW